MANELKTRGEMDPRWQWRLDHIFATEEEFEKFARNYQNKCYFSMIYIYNIQ